MNLQAEDEFVMNIKNTEEQDEYTNISYKLGTGLKIVDEFDNEIEVKKEGAIVKVDKIRIGNETTLKQVLTDLINAILNIQLNHPVSPTIPKGVINIADFQLVQKTIDEFMEIK